jgi:transcriptional regulator with XRE-family HTH domain
MLQLVLKNIKFLRSKIGLSINGLAELLNTDPTNLYQYEKDGHVFLGMEPDIFDVNQELNDLIEIANYFCVRMDDLVYSDIEEGNFFSNDWFEQLKKEYSTESKVDRTKFFTELFALDPNVSDYSKEDFLRNLLIRIHQLHENKTRYYDLRTGGRMARIDLFES